MVSASIQQKQSGLNVSLKLCLNLCLSSWLKPNLSPVNVFTLNGSLILKIFLSKSLINFNNTLQNMQHIAKHLITTRAMNVWIKFSPFTNDIWKKELLKYTNGNCSEILQNPRKASGKQYSI